MTGPWTKRPARARFVAWWNRTLIVSIFVTLDVLMVPIVLNAERSTERWIVAICLLALFLVTVHVSRIAQIDLNEDEVVIHGWRTRRIPWPLIKEVGVTRGSSAALLPWRVPYLKLEDGSTVRADEIRSMRDPSIVDEVVAAVSRRLAQSP